MSIGVQRLPKSNYSNVGVIVDAVDTDEVLLEAKDNESIGLVHVIAYNGEAAAAATVTLKAGDIDDAPVTIGKYEITAGETDVLITSPDLGLTIPGDLIVQASSAEVSISAWGVKA